MTIGSVIAEALVKNEWTLGELARRLQMSRGQLWGWKNDKFLPTKPNLKRLSRVLRIPYAELAEVASGSLAERYR